MAQYEELNKKKSKDSLFSLKNIAKTLKPTIKKIIDNLTNTKRLIRGRSNTSMRSNDSSILKEKYLNDLVNEFEDDKSKSAGSRGSSRSVSKKTSLILPNNDYSIEKINAMNNNFEKNIPGYNYQSTYERTIQPNKNTDIPLLPKNGAINTIILESLDVIKDKVPNIESKTIDPNKQKRTLKDMFSKAFNFNSNKKDISKSKLAQMLNEADEGNESNASKINPSANTINDPKKSINDIMSKIDNDRMNNSEISIKNAKLNNSSFIDLNDDHENDNNIKIDFKEGVKTEMKKFIFNIIKDETSDNYEFKTYFIKTENNGIIDKNKDINDKGIKSNFFILLKFF